MNNRIAWTDGYNTYVIRKGKTTNVKIAPPNTYVVQTYTFSNDQIDYVKSCDESGNKVELKQFFSFDKSNCLDCPLSGNSGSGSCYTHKYMQFSGFLSMIRSLLKQDIPSYITNVDTDMIVGMCRDTYVRFGTYGEPSLLPIDLVKSMASVASSWTGYTHQARKPWASTYADYFMASAHSDKEAVSLTGWRSFIAYERDDVSTAVQCPASKEASMSSNCAKCGLCSGMLGKGRKNVKILVH